MPPENRPTRHLRQERIVLAAMKAQNNPNESVRVINQFRVVPDKISNSTVAYVRSRKGFPAWKFQGYIDIDYICRRRNVLVTIIRWYRFWPFWSPTSTLSRLHHDVTNIFDPDFIPILDFRTSPWTFPLRFQIQLMSHSDSL